MLIIDGLNQTADVGRNAEPCGANSKKLYLPRCLYQLMITRRGAPQNPETTPFPSLRD